MKKFLSIFVIVSIVGLALAACGKAPPPTPVPPPPTATKVAAPATATPVPPAPTAPKTDTPQSADIPGVQLYSNLGHEHTYAPVHYDQIPPVGGDHSPELLNCGIYDQPVPNENAVHSLEHGAVWITYQPTLQQTAVDHLRQLVRGHDHVLLSPYPNLPAPVVASGWGVQLQLTGADDPRLPRFMAKYEQGPQTPEPGAPCSGGIGTPIEP